MQLLSKRFKLAGVNNYFDFDIYADTHFGSQSIDESLLKKHIAETHDSGRYWVFLGDGIDGIIPSDIRRFNSQNMTDWAWNAYKNKRIIDAEYEHWRDIFKPIADKCLFYACGDGKHNRSDNIADCRDNMLRDLRIPGAYQLVYYTFLFNRTQTNVQKVPIAFHHGFFAGRTGGSKINNLERSLSYFPEAWGFFCGHGHTKATTPPMVGIIERAGKAQSIYRRAAMTGSYIKTYADDTVGYGETKLYPPVAMGRITVRLSPFSNDDQKRIEIYNN